MRSTGWMYRFVFPGFAEVEWVLPAGVVHDEPWYEPLPAVMAVLDLHEWSLQAHLFPALDGREWARRGTPLRAGGSAVGRVAARGQHASLIAARAGFRALATVWDHPGPSRQQASLRISPRRELRTSWFRATPSRPTAYSTR